MKDIDDTYVVKYLVGLDDYPQMPFSTCGEALGYVRELFLTHSDKLHVELYLNGNPLYGNRRLHQWNRGLVTLP